MLSIVYECFGWNFSSIDTHSQRSPALNIGTLTDVLLFVSFFIVIPDKVVSRHKFV